MAASIVSSFEPWLVEKLSSISPEFDTDVFVTYIVSILDSDDPDDEKADSITELLSGVVEAEIAANTCKSILEEWKASCDRNKDNQVAEDIGDKLSEMLGKQNLATVKEKTLTNEEKARKDAILAQYAQMSDGEESDEDDDVELDEHTSSSHKSKQTPSDGLLVKNLNKDEVQKSEREMREKAKQESEKKKEKDKQDRQAQKQKQQDRKDGEKKRTQKGERKR